MVMPSACLASSDSEFLPWSLRESLSREWGPRGVGEAKSKGKSIWSWVNVDTKTSDLALVPIWLGTGQQVQVMPGLLVCPYSAVVPSLHGSPLTRLFGYPALGAAGRSEGGTTSAVPSTHLPDKSGACLSCSSGLLEEREEVSRAPSIAVVEFVSGPRMKISQQGRFHARQVEGATWVAARGTHWSSDQAWFSLARRHPSLQGVSAPG